MLKSNIKMMGFLLKPLQQYFEKIIITNNVEI